MVWYGIVADGVQVRMIPLAGCVAGLVCAQDVFGTPAAVEMSVGYGSKHTSTHDFAPILTYIWHCWLLYVVSLVAVAAGSR